MSDPIQRKGPGGVGEVGGAPAEGAGEAFRAAVAGARPEASGAGRAEALQAIAAEVRAGRLEPGAAVERLVERILSEGPASSLPAAQREQLGSLLRAQLANDPTLLALQRDLGR
jgi:hypothetical protein